MTCLEIAIMLYIHVSTTNQGCLCSLLLMSAIKLLQVLVSVKLIDEAYSKILKQNPLRQQAGDYMTQLQGGYIITEYLKQLHQWGLDDSAHL